METEKNQSGIRDAWKAQGGGRVEGAIVEMVEGVADHQPQRPFLSLKENLLMVQRSPPTLLFVFAITMQKGRVVAPMQL